MSNQYMGSDFDEFLREEGIFQEVEAAAVKKVLACMIEQTMAETHITKSEMARRMPAPSENTRPKTASRSK